MEPNEGFPDFEHELIPAWKDIPEEFKSDKNEWVKRFDDMFFNDCRVDCEPKSGIDGNKALKHIRRAMTSYAFQHEHKEAGVAYLLSQWFEKFDLTKIDK